MNDVVAEQERARRLQRQSRSTVQRCRRARALAEVAVTHARARAMTATAEYFELAARFEAIASDSMATTGSPSPSGR